MNTAMHPMKFDFFSLREARPMGWLRNQLLIQARGLSGHLDEFWPDIADSKWIGGACEGWERVPYWLDGFIPLARLLDDEDMLARARRYMDKIFEGQDRDGWLCPCAPEERRGYDMWALILIAKVMTVWHDATGDERVEGALYRAFRQWDRHLDGNTLFGWGQTRWFEALISIRWLYLRRPEAWLLALAQKVRSQGFDWISLFERWPYEQPLERGRWSYMSHVVNCGMMIKSGALAFLFSGDARDLAAPAIAYDTLDRFHGMVTGMFTGDECLAGLSPVQGTELCAVVELMYSCEWLSAVTGEARWGDLLEKLAYNCLPATFSPDMWSHQYDQQVNQVECSLQPIPVFNTNGPESNLFGLEPNYGCCTANLSQGWPKLAQSVFMKTQSGVAVAAWAPAELKTHINGVAVEIEIVTDYPFRDSAKIAVRAASPVAFSLSLRIPAWAQAPVADKDGVAVALTPGAYSNVAISGSCELTVTLPMRARLERRPADMAALVRGPLVYSLAIGEDWRRLPEQPGREFPHCDYEVLPTTAWNYAFADGDIAFVEHEMGELPFSPEGAPVSARVRAARIPWGMYRGAALPLPEGRAPVGAPETLRFIPYGCTTLRMTEMPCIQKRCIEKPCVEKPCVEKPCIGKGGTHA